MQPRCGSDAMCEMIHQERASLYVELQLLIQALDRMPFGQRPHAELTRARKLWERLEA
jgi:hypothetical protein